MASELAERRLSAILAVDVVGYSRLVGRDEVGTIARLKALRKEVIDPCLARHGGRVVKTMGDGLLIEFSSVVEAVQNAVEVQQSTAARNAGVPEDEQIVFRAGVNLGDIVIDGEDILGDGVNVASRLETMCEPGGLCISDIVYQAIEGKAEHVFYDLGEQRLKNIAKPIRVWRWHPDTTGKWRPSVVAAPPVEQRIKFCTAPDGVTIAYAVVGDGPPLLKSPNWMNHLEYDWQSPVWRHLLLALAADHSLIRFDQRTNGLSDWDVPDVSFDSMVSDMEAVVEATGLQRFPLLGISQGCAYSIAYAVRNPERVSRLVLYGGFAVGALRAGSESDKQKRQMLALMMEQGWGQNTPAFRQAFTTLLMPGATKDQMDWFNELQRITASPENAVRLFGVTGNVDVVDLLPRISVPTLVLHCREDAMVPFDRGRKMAAGIPGARFVALEGQNHLFLEDEPAWPRFLEEVTTFLAAEDLVDG
jgi:class 3 adenylate cyclase/pimeloyl-ACP methyl ester carboxylesterase